jgi:hypothetical protein
MPVVAIVVNFFLVGLIFEGEKRSKDCAVSSLAHIFRIDELGKDFGNSLR